jgi:hypothetical protein
VVEVRCVHFLDEKAPTSSPLVQRCSEKTTYIRTTGMQGVLNDLVAVQKIGMRAPMIGTQALKAGMRALKAAQNIPAEVPMNHCGVLVLKAAASRLVELPR